MGELEYGVEKLAGGVAPDVGGNNIEKRSWHGMGKVPGEGCALVDENAIGVGL